MTNNSSPLSRAGGSIRLPGSNRKQLSREERLEEICGVYDALCRYERAAKIDLSRMKSLVNKTYDLAAAGRPYDEEAREIVALTEDLVRSFVQEQMLEGRELRAAAVRIFVVEGAAGEALE